MMIIFDIEIYMFLDESVHESSSSRDTKFFSSPGEDKIEKIIFVNYIKKLTLAFRGSVQSPDVSSIFNRAPFIVSGSDIFGKKC